MYRIKAIGLIMFIFLLQQVFAQGNIISFSRVEQKDGNTETWTITTQRINNLFYTISKNNYNDTIKLTPYQTFGKYQFYHIDYTFSLQEPNVSLHILDSKMKHLFKKEIQHKFTNPDSVTFLAGSCNLLRSDLKRTFPYVFPYLLTNKNIGSCRIFTHMQQENKDFMLWMGDNVYYVGKPNHGSLRKMIRRQVRHRKVKEINTFVSNSIMHSTWDDHDFGPNNACCDFQRKSLTRKAFNLFWNDTMDFVFQGENIAKYFEKGPCAFFVLDVRWDRKDGKTMLGKEQLEWLKMKLKSCEKPVKFIVSGSQVLNNSTLTDTWKSFGNEREDFLSFIKNEKINGVVFLSGDRHLSCMFQRKITDTYTLYDYTTSPLTSFPFAKLMSKRFDFPQDGFIESSFTNKHNYAKIAVHKNGSFYDILFETKDNKGKVIWSKTISTAELQ